MCRKNPERSNEFGISKVINKKPKKELENEINSRDHSWKNSPPPTTTRSQKCRTKKWWYSKQNVLKVELEQFEQVKKNRESEKRIVRTEKQKKKKTENHAEGLKKLMLEFY